MCVPAIAPAPMKPMRKGFSLPVLLLLVLTYISLNHVCSCDGRAQSLLHRARPDGRSSYGCAHAVQSRAESARCRAALQMNVEIGERPVWRQLRATCIRARCANADRGFPYDTAMCTTATNSATPAARKI